jgi:hypothetical protein
MNILIYGDNSAAGLNLIPGFEKLGYEVDYVSNEDTKRNYYISIPIRSGKSKIMRRTSGIVNSLTLPLKLKKKYEIVIIANPFIGPYILSNIVFRTLRERTNNLFWWITTCDTRMRLWSDLNNKPLCEKCNEGRGTRNHCPKFNEQAIKYESRIEEYVDEIIPCGLEYASGHLMENKDIKIIPLSASIISNEPKKNNSLNTRMGSKLKFYHGADSIWKGSDVIGEAFSSLQKKWPSKANFNLGKYMQLKEYLSFVHEQDIIIDQLYNKSHGVNSLLIMQSGKLLVSGSCEQYESFTGQPQAPMVRLNGEYSNLVEKIDDIISNWDHYLDMRAEGPHYVDKYFSPVVIAKKFLQRIKG